jgi:putative ABC transport system ATP-binding protein
MSVITGNWRLLSMMDFIKMANVRKTYKMGEVSIHALDGIEFTITEGEFVVIVGPSGAGKTTVLNILGGMDTTSEGTVLVAGTDIANYNEKQLTKYRRDEIGFVFQFYNLVQNLTAKENVELASQICKAPLDAELVLKEVGLEERINNFPAQLSGGEQQRVAIARALAKNPKLLLCDEPTGALDYMTGKAILKLLQDTCKERNMTVIVITHNTALTPMADRVIKIKNGKVTKVTLNDNPVSVDTIEW